MLKRYVSFAFAILLAVAAYFIPINEPRAQAVLSITAFAVIMWISEAVPLHATALIISLPLILWVGLPERTVFANYFDPVVVLLLGGLVIAVAMTKHGLDAYFAHKIISKFGKSSYAVLFGLLLTTALISMWISNTAAAAMMMPIALVVLSKNNMRPLQSKFGKAAVLAVAYGATIGGIGTIIGSTPNVIAAKYLNNAGETFGFIHWFYRGFPLMLIMIAIVWLALLLLFKPEKNKLEIAKQQRTLDREQKKVLGIFAFTILFWITETFHHISSANVALISIILFYSARSLDGGDFLKVDWEVIILIGGGLALGYGIHESGLDAIFVNSIKSIVSANPFLLLLVIAAFGVMFTSLISNTTASAVYIPLVTALAAASGLNVTNTVMVAAVGVSFDFIFPFGTPPSAIAYSTKFVMIKDMIKAGFLISATGILLLALIALVW
ncbi:DASS family sodium-coupled anion symporter [Candidatus Woesearchaeota archaeon]|nr:DASS family sodium-coupled anion symporter [Candidatus Woesearchaeota archaeon]